MGIATAGERRLLVKERTMGDVSRRPTHNVITFPPAEARPPRRVLAGEAPRGEILLFMGVRYERVAEPSPEPRRPGRRAARRRG
jgi:hypothetical protein